MWREPGLYDCALCEENPRLMADYGHCGGPSPGRLPLLVGDPVDSCPTALGIHDVEVIRLGSLLPAAAWDGDLSDVDRLSLPPYYRRALDMARGWVAEYKRKVEARVGQ